MTKIIKGDLILTKDTTFNESIKVEGNIEGWFNLKVVGNIDAWNIDAWNIDAWNIDAWNIDAGNINAGNIIAGDINAGNINAGNINAGNIVCETRTKKSKTSKTICRVYVKNKSQIERKEQED